MKKTWSNKSKNIHIPLTNKTRSESAKVIAAISSQGTFVYKVT